MNKRNPTEEIYFKAKQKGQNLVKIFKEKNNKKLTSVFVLFGKDENNEPCIYGVFESNGDARKELDSLINEEKLIYQANIERHWIINKDAVYINDTMSQETINKLKKKID